jgi:hypothetical protein
MVATVNMNGRSCMILLALRGGRRYQTRNSRAEMKQTREELCANGRLLKFSASCIIAERHYKSLQRSGKIWCAILTQ